MNKTIIWIIIAIIVVGGIFLLVDSNETLINESNSQVDDIDQLSESGRVTNTNENILAEIDEAINYLD
jgi:hypothetical protein